MLVLKFVVIFYSFIPCSSRDIGGDNLTIFHELFLFVVLLFRFFDCCFLGGTNVCTAKVLVLKIVRKNLKLRFSFSK